MKQLKFVAMALLALSFTFTSCDDTDDVMVVNGLTYTLNGGSTVMMVDSTIAYSTYNSIIAYANSGRDVMSIELTGLTKGTYTLVTLPTVVEAFTLGSKVKSVAIVPTFDFYYNPSNSVYFWATAGTVVISKVENNMISGTFEITAGSEDSAAGSTPINTIKGAFANVPISAGGGNFK